LDIPRSIRDEGCDPSSSGQQPGMDGGMSVVRCRPIFDIQIYWANDEADAFASALMQEMTRNAESIKRVDRTVP
jgi:hypothetical protein